MSDTEFPYSLIISIPLPTTRLASSALRTLEVDTELSPFVRRELSVTSSSSPKGSEPDPEAPATLEATYRATTNRMLRVSVNGFMENMNVILGVMEELDVDVLDAEESAEKR